MPDCQPPCVHPDDILTAGEIRELAGGITRHTLIAWRRNRGFPEPIKTAPGHGGALELWDARAVRAWLEEHR